MRSSLFLELENTWWKRVLLAKLRFFERSSTLRYLFLSVPSIFRLCGKLLSSSRLFPFPLSILPTLPQMLRTWLKARQHRDTEERKRRIYMEGCRFKFRNPRQPFFLLHVSRYIAHERITFYGFSFYGLIAS